MSCSLKPEAQPRPTRWKEKAARGSRSGSARNSLGCVALQGLSFPRDPHQTGRVKVAAVGAQGSLGLRRGRKREGGREKGALEREHSGGSKAFRQTSGQAGVVAEAVTRASSLKVRTYRPRAQPRPGRSNGPSPATEGAAAPSPLGNLRTGRIYSASPMADRP
ncbi:hypothetical protein CDD83_5417 [Cordyceps sp. RAO-2017]|nr:hypothetical protein CDD83_5417 [Cordyceps sp. RAO-2017]